MTPPHLGRISEVDPRRRRIHVIGEMHPGELEGRGYKKVGGEFVLEIQAPMNPKKDTDRFVEEFVALQGMGYAFLEGDEEWSPAGMFRKYRDRGAVKGPFRAMGPDGVKVDA